MVLPVEQPVGYTGPGGGAQIDPLDFVLLQGGTQIPAKIAVKEGLVIDGSPHAIGGFFTIGLPSFVLGRQLQGVIGALQSGGKFAAQAEFPSVALLARQIQPGLVVPVTLQLLFGLPRPDHLRIVSLPGPGRRHPAHRRV